MSKPLNASAYRKWIGKRITYDTPRRTCGMGLSGVVQEITGRNVKISGEYLYYDEIANARLIEELTDTPPSP